MFYDRRLVRELKAAGLQRFQEGDIDSINPDLPLGAQADLLPVKLSFDLISLAAYPVHLKRL